MQIVTGVLLAVLGLVAQETGKRHGIEPDVKSFPQATAKEALTSVLKAIDLKRFDYLAAQLADPAFIDDRVKRLHGGRFEAQVEETRDNLGPGAVKLLQRFLKDGEWAIEKGQATVTLKDVNDRCVYLKQIGDRWYLEHRSKPMK